MATTKLGDITLVKQTGTTLTILTEETYVATDVSFDIDVQSAVAVSTATADADIQSDSSSQNISSSIGQKSDTAPSSGYYLKVGASGAGITSATTAGWIDEGSIGTASANVSKYFPVDAATASISGTNIVTPSASVSGNNVTLSNTNNGISVTATGGGSASASVSSACLTSGYAASGDILGSETIAGSSQTTTASTYISGVNLGIPSSGTNTFTVSVPNGDNDTITLLFEVDEYGNSNITEDMPYATGVSF